MFGRVCATDVSSRMLELCSKTVRNPAVSFQRTDGFTLREFGDATIDVVYSHDTFVHFSAMQVYPYLREIRRILRQGGIGVISFVDFVASFQEFSRMSMRYWSQRTYPPMTRLHFTSEEAICRMLTDLDLRFLKARKGNFLIVVFEKKNA